LVLEQVLKNAPHFAFSSGICSETEVSEQLYFLAEFIRKLQFPNKSNIQNRPDRKGDKE
jgi:hypothetical protein